MGTEKVSEKDKVIAKKPEEVHPGVVHEEGREKTKPHMLLQRILGNRAIQRLVLQGKGDGSHELDEETSIRIHRERGGGQALDESVSQKMGATMGYDFRGVRVHTSSEATELSNQLNAKAFTTGQDIFFREGAYDPHSSGGQELLAHELTHVVQQGTGLVSGSGRMKVNAPGDTFEQQADASARAALSPGVGGEVNRQVEIPEEEEEPVQVQEEDEDLAQAQEEDEEDLAQTQEEDELETEG
jgi:hypothetical protein